MESLVLPHMAICGSYIHIYIYIHYLPNILKPGEYKEYFTDLTRKEIIIKDEENGCKFEAMERILDIHVICLVNSYLE